MNHPYEGRCLCGDIEYRAWGSGRNLAYCHCASCRGAAGAPMVAWVTFDADKFAFTAGAPAVFASSGPVRRKFCNRCGTALTYEHQGRPSEIDVTMASLRDGHGLRPEAHIWVSNKAPWVVIADGLPQFPEWPPA
jgi:hypothetical protein